RLAEMRAAQEAAGDATMYDRRCLTTLTREEAARRVRDGAPHVIRMRMPREGVTTFHDLIRGAVSFENALIDDQVLIKADGFPTYHLATVVDDHLMRITHITRAEEWISSTPKHLTLFRMFGWEAPQFAHFPLLRNADRSKISKRQGHTSLHWYQAEGILPEALLNFLALLGWSHPEEKEIFDLNELIANFTFERFNTSGPVFDLEKLRWLNGVYIRALAIDDLYPRVEPFLIKAGILQAQPVPEEQAFAKQCIALEQEKARALTEFPDLVSFLFNPNFPYDDEVVAQWLRPAPAHVRPALSTLLEQVEALPDADITAERLEEIVRRIAEELGVGAGKVIHPTRAALSGRAKGPSLFHMMAVLGKAEIRYRLKRTLEMMKGG
ncbi:MAG TPA: glutamate--tRNA ligase, partial [Armatimonadota bacterium]|nr:glutamate--tRNA ligase [Armatimonadota bacterium]